MPLKKMAVATIFSTITYSSIEMSFWIKFFPHTHIKWWKKAFTQTTMNHETNTINSKKSTLLQNVNLINIRIEVVFNEF